jgi:hypothetical protein
MLFAMVFAVAPIMQSAGFSIASPQPILPIAVISVALLVPLLGFAIGILLRQLGFEQIAEGPLVAASQLIPYARN